MTEHELESKFYLVNPQEFSKKISALGARLISPRTNEWNLRFDTSDNRLSNSGQALRLRKDDRSRLTFKGPSDLNSEITSRRELEVEVSDFATTQKILEALGYQVAVIYEKFRTTWSLDGTEVVLDELPIGFFCEIEGENASQIQSVAEKLDLHWDHRISSSYLSIFAQLKASLEWPNINLVYEEMNHFIVEKYDLESVGIYPADME